LTTSGLLMIYECHERRKASGQMILQMPFVL